jgi:hypothetical protein
MGIQEILLRGLKQFTGSYLVIDVVKPDAKDQSKQRSQERNDKHISQHLNIIPYQMEALNWGILLFEFETTDTVTSAQLIHLLKDSDDQLKEFQQEFQQTFAGVDLQINERDSQGDQADVIAKILKNMDGNQLNSFVLCSGEHLLCDDSAEKTRDGDRRTQKTSSLEEIKRKRREHFEQLSGIEQRVTEERLGHRHCEGEPAPSLDEIRSIMQNIRQEKESRNANQLTTSKSQIDQQTDDLQHLQDDFRSMPTCAHRSTIALFYHISCQMKTPQNSISKKKSRKNWKRWSRDSNWRVYHRSTNLSQN